MHTTESIMMTANTGIITYHTEKEFLGSSSAMIFSFPRVVVSFSGNLSKSSVVNVISADFTDTPSGREEPP